MRAWIGAATLAAILLALPGCAAALPRHVPAPAAAPVVVREVSVRVAPNLSVYRGGLFVPVWGITASVQDGPLDVLFDASMTQFGYVAPMVAAHEFGHVLGVIDHDPGCPWMRPSMPKDTPLVAMPDAATIARAKAMSAGKQFVLRVEPGVEPKFLDAMRWAVSSWNRVLGRTALVLRVGYAPETTQPRPPRGT